ncbi:MAG: type II toxin-antitoxin system VapC family toxin [bacterium]|nr:type II toxin-antitoxin system VapC family toxin [bacterium]
MNGKFLLDTNAVISYLADEPETLKVINELEEIFVPVTVIGELYFGAFKSRQVEKNLQVIADFLVDIPVLGNNIDTGRIYGQIKNKLKKKGKPIPENDIWIAATALQLDLTVVTKDAHFKNIDNLRLYDEIIH